MATETTRAPGIGSRDADPNDSYDGQAAEHRRTWLVGLSHDLRQALTVILGTTQVAERRLLIEGHALDTISTSLGVIRKAAHRLQRQLAELDEFAAGEAERVLSLNRCEVNLVALVRDCMDRHAGLSDSHRFSVIVDGDDGIPIIGMWDELRLERAIDNLIDNAIKYSPGGGGIKIKVARTLTADLVGIAVLEVHDEGVGIPSDDLPHVFKWFRRARNAESISTGSGIGLAVVQQVIEQHGGTVEAASEPGCGSTFRLRLPLTA